MKKATLLLEDGRQFIGKSFGAEGEALGEVVFNTSMTGYQEILTDPSYKYQMVTMTYPMIGNYGVNTEDIESDSVQVSAFVVKEYSKTYSNYRANMSLGDYLKKAGVLGIEGLDTRALTKHIREQGAMRAILSTMDHEPKSLMRKVKASAEMAGMDLVKDVTCAKPYTFKTGSTVELEAYPTTTKVKGDCHIVAYDFGVKKNILRKLVDRGCKVTVVPASVPYQEMLAAYKPDGVFLTNGPGDPAAVLYAIENIKGLIAENVPMFGICLGHQLLNLALGAKTYKLKFGHRGGNQPVRFEDNGKVEITAQNHGFCVDDATVPKNVKVTHINLNDMTVEGIEVQNSPCFSVQYHPEASPGPHDSDYLFDRFVKLVQSESA